MASRYEGVKSYSALQMRTMRRRRGDGKGVEISGTASARCSPLRDQKVNPWSFLVGVHVTEIRYWRFQLATIGVTVLSGSLSNSLTHLGGGEEDVDVCWCC